MNQFLKKYWYVILVSIVFVIGIAAVIINQGAGQVSSKQIDGKYVVSSIDGHNLTADELYAQAQEQYEGPLASLIFEKEVLERTFEYTEDEKVQARLEGDQTIAYYKSMLGEDVAEEIISNQLQAMGYDADDTISDYYLNAAASERLINNYFEENIEEDLFADEQPVLVSHILVRPQQEGETDEEETDEIDEATQAKMDEIDKALEEKEFGEVALEMSADPGSAKNNGSLGIVYKSISFHPEFLDATYDLEVGEVSDWIKSPSGWHKIVITSDDREEIKSHPEFNQLMSTYAPNLRGLAFFQQAENLNIDFSDNPEFEEQLRTRYGLGGQE